MGLRILLACVCIVLLFYIVRLVSGGRLLVRYSLLWLVMAILALSIAIWPEPFYALSSMLGFMSPSNFMLLAGVLCLLLVCLSMSVIIARQANSLARLNHRLSRLENHQHDNMPTFAKNSDAHVCKESNVKSTEPLSIVIFSAQYVPHIGGVETFTDNLSKTLVKRGHQVLVVTNNTEGLDSHEMTPEGVEVIRLPCFPFLAGRYPIPRPCREWNDLHDSLLRRQFDGVLVNTRFYPHSLIGLSIAKHAGVRPVLLDHGSAYLCFDNVILDAILNKYEDAITSLGRREYDPAYYGISRRSVEWLTHFGIEALGVINNSIDAEEFRAQASKRDFRSEIPDSTCCKLLVAFIGRLVPEKGVPAILEAASNPVLRNRGVVFAIAGRGPLERALRSAPDNVVYFGSLDRSDVSALLQQADINLLPSRSEGFSTNLLEASACCCPSITTPIGGAAELIPSLKYGTVISEPTESQITQAIMALADNPDLLKSQAQACQELVQRSYSWNSTAEKLEMAFVSVRHKQL